MKGDAREIYYWAESALRGVDKARAALTKAGNAIRDHIIPACHQNKVQDALNFKANVERRIWRSLGVMLDPTVSNYDAEQLAMRVFGERNEEQGGDRHLVIMGRLPKYNEDTAAVARSKINHYAEKLFEDRSSRVPTQEVIAKLANQGWDEYKWAEMWGEYLKHVFSEGRCSHCKRQGGTVNQKAAAIKMFMDAKIEIEKHLQTDEVHLDFDSMPDEELRRLTDSIVHHAMREPTGDLS